MIHTEYHTCNLPPKASINFFCKGNAMNTISRIENQSLPPAERLALTACLGNLLTMLGTLLQEHPDLCTKLSTETGEMLIGIGEKLNRIYESMSA